MLFYGVGLLLFLLQEDHGDGDHDGAACGADAHPEPNGGSLGLIRLGTAADGIKDILVLEAADLAGAGLLAGFGGGGLLGGGPITEGVGVGLGDLLAGLQRYIAHGAYGVAGVAGFGAGGILLIGKGLGVAGLSGGLAGGELLAALGAVGIAGVALFLAGGLLHIAKLGGGVGAGGRLGGAGVAGITGVAGVTGVTGAGVAAGGIAGGGGHILGSLSAEERPGQLGIGAQDTTDPEEGLDSVVSAHFPGIYGIFLHPFQQNIQILDDTAFAPGIAGIAPANISIQYDSCTIASDGEIIYCAAIGIVVSGAFTISGVAAGRILADDRGTDHHDIVFVVSVKSLTVGPSMLFVVCITAIPCAADNSSGIEGRENRGFVADTIGVAEIVVILFICVLMGVSFGHHILERGIKCALMRIVLCGATGVLDQCGIGIAAGVEILSICT